MDLFDYECRQQHTRLCEFCSKRFLAYYEYTLSAPTQFLLLVTEYTALVYKEPSSTQMGGSICTPPVISSRQQIVLRNGSFMTCN